MSTLEQLEAKANAAQQHHEKAQQAAAQARQQAAAERAARLAAYDRQLVNDFETAAEVAAFTQSRTDLREAIAASTLGQAWIRFKAAELRRTHTASAVNAAADRLGLPHPTVAQPANRAHARRDLAGC